ncbi:beta-glucuronidase [Balneolaceae bacterium YR4-1]|uniref:Beta-glucuronidase n=1 Tax=Halalkalibaculum roseum TaxID=2709311 RepID=A0A6M1SXL9_9BACT|nr:glycoside hydrolase family 2 TIM barrel-domain containing protein [Halalkalibaculum roseum]NGP77782.1 beta-glucuronidase [Halalkalibaculum roseum]
MRNIATVLFILTLYASCSFAQNIVPVNIYNRSAQSLIGEWHYVVDPYENGYYNYRYEPFDQMENPGKNAFFMNAKPDDKTDLVEYNFDRSPTMEIPGDWNSQVEKLYYYEGSVWFKKSFDYLRKTDSSRVLLYFGAVNYKAEVYLNGTKLGTHIGGFTPFSFEVTNLLNEKDNFLILKVDNTRKKEGIPTLNTDWWNYGGITRDVKLVEMPQTFIRDYMIQLSPENAQTIEGFMSLDGTSSANQEVTISIPELDLRKTLNTDSEGSASLDLKSDNINYWSPENPYLYEVVLTTPSDTLEDRIGFRTIETEGGRILLNDQPVFLRGISIHEERPFDDGRVRNKKQAKQLLQWAKELGCNYVRLAHYPHNEHMVRLADEMGILVWEEIPVYWTIDWNNTATLKNAKNQLNEVIQRDRNRASVIIWSMANETPVSKARNNFLNELATLTRSLDKTRLISAALEQSSLEGNPNIRTIDDPFADVVDVLSFNQYIGWYEGLPSKAREITWEISQNKPVIISEFGAGAKQGFHADSLTRWSEEYQAYLYSETLNMIDKIDGLSGLSPWILADFRSPRRQLPDIQDEWNRKGLISDDGIKKKAFFVLKSYYENKLKLWNTDSRR